MHSRNTLAALLLSTGLLAGPACSEPAADFSKEIAAVKQRYEETQNQYYASVDPIIPGTQQADRYVEYDQRFSEVIDRMTVMFLASPEKQAEYGWSTGKGYFKGSAEEYARFRAVNWLGEWIWPENAAVYDPDRTTHSDLLLKRWRAADEAGHGKAEQRCDTKWTDRMPIAGLAKEFSEAAAQYTEIASMDPTAEAFFNPYSVQFTSLESRQSFLWSAAASWLMSPYEPEAHSAGCAETFTNFDAWALSSARKSKSAEPSSPNSAPEKVMGLEVRP